MEIKTLDEIKDQYFGQQGTAERDSLESELQALRIGLQIRNARMRQNITQSVLAERVGKNRAFISRVENDGTNLTLKTLRDIVEIGLGGKLEIQFNL